jgi:hypothetical protein
MHFYLKLKQWYLEFKNHHTTQAFGAVEVWYTHNPILAFAEGEWLASWPSCFICREKSSGTHGDLHTWFVHCGKETIILPPTKAHILIIMPVQLIELYRPTLNKSDLFQCRLTNTKFYQNSRSIVKSEIWTAQRECDLSSTVFSRALCIYHYYAISCILCIPLLCHYVYPLHTVTMSLCVFSAYRYYIIMCILCKLLKCHYLYSLHNVTMSLCVFSAYHYYVIMCIFCIPLICH